MQTSRKNHYSIDFLSQSSGNFYASSSTFVIDDAPTIEATAYPGYIFENWIGGYILSSRPTIRVLLELFLILKMVLKI